jgi:arylsulfatase A-like enzyme
VRVAFFSLSLSLGLDSVSQADTIAKPNVLMIMLDTVRADHSSTYGYSKNTTPNLTRIASRGVLFERAYAPMATTGPSTATAFTSLYPIAHGYLKNGVVLEEHYTTAAELFKGAGYRTEAFISSKALQRKFRIDQGFDKYVDSWSAGEARKFNRDKRGKRGSLSPRSDRQFYDR